MKFNLSEVAETVTGIKEKFPDVSPHAALQAAMHYHLILAILNLLNN